MDEIIHIACFIKDEPLEANNDSVILAAEAWRDSNIKKTVDVRLNLKTDLYLDCLSAISEIEDDVHLYFITNDSWKALKKVFKHSNFAFLLEDGFDLMVEEEEFMVTIKEF
jgi:methionine salvage enolase-phosphatase E1